MSFWRQKLSQFVIKFVSQNKAKNAGRSGKNAGMREIESTSKCGISRTIAGWLTPMVTAPISIIDTFVSYVVIERKYYLICFPRELSQTSAGMVM